jgi:hypothetical protein
MLNKVQLLSRKDNKSKELIKKLEYKLAEVLFSKYKNNSILIHVKKGFNNTIRELTSQIDIAARALKEAHSTGDCDFVEQLYESLTEKKKSKTPYF